MNYYEQDLKLALAPNFSNHLYDVKIADLINYAYAGAKREPFQGDELFGVFQVIPQIRGPEGGYKVIMCDREKAPSVDMMYTVSVSPSTLLMSDYPISVTEGFILFEAMWRIYDSHVAKTNYRLPSPIANQKKPELSIIEIRHNTDNGLVFMCDTDMCLIGAAEPNLDGVPDHG